MSLRAGFIGLGTMGLAMARNLARAGFSLTLHTRTPGKAEALARELRAENASVQAAATPADVARAADVVVSCVPDTPEVESVHLGPNGSIQGAAAGTVIVDCSTIAPEDARRIAGSIASCGASFLDAPVSGGQKGAVEGKLTFFVGGEAEALERARPVLEAMGKRITLLGPSGSGQLGKAVNQIIVALNLMAVSEGLVFAQRAGLPVEALHEALTGGAANSWALEVLGKKMIDRDFKPAFAIKHQQKDLAIVLRAARQLGVPLFGVSTAHQLLAVLEGQGAGEDGTQALFRLYERLAGGEGS